ncbi:beta-glucosidase/6-phospho-beta-glucosidase/beta-galactosidase [Glaciihabitans tibetensis]|uniref:beta-glucosidase n=1 Tax=Glaciihabitans tibetensis TaxID=1266600 RepID=A0A2T0V2A5_9MICO|nr:family 1 glycosylhydrolase [Glaciihabitans tibetensis]PRY64313.1 beta-glucosidase/6-phospho-beta-glucosidase/beta-galactosidase [Glaciihabitans tibetensis]
MTRTFPEGFVWGTGTSAYQVEGAWDADGKVPSVWDTALHSWLRTPDGTSGDRAIDQYHRLDEDLDLLQRLGAGAHRFSAAWPRIVTDAAGTVNPAGLDYYERVVDGLLARGIAPALNLYHWDTPQWMEDLGGMMTREFADHFGHFASVLAERLGDRVDQWFTMNEPTHPSLGGYVAGFLPPARREGTAGLASVHHLLLAHGTSILALRAAGAVGDIGTILSMNGVAPATTHPLDVAAAARADYFDGRLFLDPMLGHGHLPELAAVLGDTVREGDLDIIAQPMDVLGVNWYSRYTVASTERAAAHLAELPPRAAMFHGLAPVTAGLGFAIVPAPGLPWGGAHRQLTPGGFREALDWLADTYPDHPDVVITENGIGYADKPDVDGEVRDEARIRYLSWAIREVADAIADGVRVRGYHAWSSHDNLQYMAGFTQRFGLIHVDPDTLVRTPKASFDWYREVVRTGVVPTAVEQYPTGDHTGIDVPGVRNARGIGGLETVDGRHVREGLVFRSAGLHAITDEGRQALSELGVDTILDLRGRSEAARVPDEFPGVRLVHLPLHEPADPGAGSVLGAAADASGTPGLRDLYREIALTRGGEMVAGLRAIASADGAVLAHCTAGKDRTGVFIAVLLAAIGVRDDHIVRTYAESDERLGAEFRSEVMALLHPGSSGNSSFTEDALDDMLASPAELIEEVLETIRHDHGTVATYLAAFGFPSDELAGLRRKLVD